MGICMLFTTCNPPPPFSIHASEMLFFSRSSVPRLLFSIDMPDNVVRQAIDAVTSALSHFGKALCFGLVFKGVAGEVDAGAVHVCFDEDVDAADAIEGHLLVLVCTFVAEFSHVASLGRELLVACRMS